jgi:DeoR/GlpR family transcriptional regulator of sugar metabolism
VHNHHLCLSHGAYCAPGILLCTIVHDTACLSVCWVAQMAHSNLLLDERHRVIRERLAVDGRVIAADLARELGTSEDTIRRDLRELASLGECRRVYGGALSISPASGFFAERPTQDVDGKVALAREAAKLAAPGQIVFLAAGSTNLVIARTLPNDANMTVVTNAPAVALAVLGRTGFEVILVGGVMDVRAGAALGAQAVRDVSGMAPDICFVGACAVDPKLGVRAFGFEDAVFKRALLERSHVVVVASTNDELSTSAPFEVMPAADIDHLIVEHDAPAKLLSFFEQVGVRVHRSLAAEDKR